MTLAEVRAYILLQISDLEADVDELDSRVERAETRGALEAYQDLLDKIDGATVPA